MFKSTDIKGTVKNVLLSNLKGLFAQNLLQRIKCLYLIHVVLKAANVECTLVYFVNLTRITLHLFQRGFQNFE